MLKRAFSVFYKGSVPGITAWWAGAGGAIGIFLLMVPAVNGWIPTITLPSWVTTTVCGVFVGLIVGSSNVTRQRDELKSRLDNRERDREHWLRTAHKLGEFGIQGKALIPKPYTEVASWDDVNDWKYDVASFIETNLG